MYEEIRKPKLLKDVPIALIRALPTLYYTNKFANTDTNKRILDLYQSNVRYLNQALDNIGQQLGNNEFQALAKHVLELESPPSAQIFEKTQAYSIKLAELCSSNRDEIRKNSYEIKSQLASLYTSLVNTIKVLVIDNTCGKEDISKIIGILKNLCHYHVDQTEPSASDITTKLIDADFSLFYSIASPDIHHQVHSLQTYHMPGLAMMQMSKNVSIDKEAIRHGSQLIKSGFGVLFKMFTPIRLFTSIDKTYLTFHLTNKFASVT